MARNHKYARLYSLAWITIIILCLIAFTLISTAPWKRQNNLQDVKRAKEAESRELDHQVAGLRSQQERIHTDRRFVERIAREMGMVKPNEFVLKPKPEPNQDRE